MNQPDFRRAFEKLKDVALHVKPFTPEEKNSLITELKKGLLLCDDRNKQWVRETVNRQFAYKSNNFEGNATLLHVVSDAHHWDLDLVDLLMECGADPMIPDSFFRSPLHWAVSHGCYCSSCDNRAAKCIKLLLEKYQNRVCIQPNGNEQRTKASVSLLVNAQDFEGNTALFLAARNLFPKPAEILLHFGANVFLQNVEQIQKSKVSKINERLIDTIVQSIPSVLTVRLDGAIREKSNSGRKYQKDDFSRNEKPFSATNSNIRHPISLEIDFSLITKQRSKLDADGNTVRGSEVDFFTPMIKADETSRELLFDHPVTEVFMFRKYSRIIWWFIGGIILFFLLCGFFTHFVFIYYLGNCPYQEDRNTTMLPPVDATEEEKRNYHRCPAWWNTYLLGWVNCMYAGLMALGQVLAIIPQKCNYFDHWKMALGWWLLIAGIGISSYPPLGGWYPKNWNHSIAAFTVFWFWTMMLAACTTITRVAICMHMLLKVISTAMFCVLLYGLIVVGFGFGFHVMFPENEIFGNPYLSFVKLLLLMLGDTDYDGIFEDNKTDDYFFTITAHFFYAAFLILVTIVFMNLLIGLSVSDIQKLKETSKTAGLTGQLLAIDIFEKQLFSKVVEYCFERFCMKKILQKVQDFFSILTTERAKLVFSPYDPNDKTIPKDLQLRLLNLYKSTFCRDSNFFASPKFFNNRLSQCEAFDDFGSCN